MDGKDVMDLTNPAGIGNGFAAAPLRPQHVSHRELLRLDEARELVVADDLGKWDATARRADIVLKDGLVAFPLDRHGEHWEYLTPTTWATGQFCARLGIPAAYFRKCPTVLQDIQFNYWAKETKHRNRGSDAARNGTAEAINDENSNADTSSTDNSNEQWLLRAKGGSLRAVLSDRYSRLDNVTLMECLAPMLDARYRVDWFGLSNESLHLRIIDPERTREVLPEDAITVGIHLANSEVGFRSVTVDALVYRLVCSNGLIRLVKGKSLLRQRHIHVAQPRFVAALEEAIENALGEADGFIEQLRRTTAQPVEDVESTLKRLGERWNLTDSTREAVQGALLREVPSQQETLYGVVNAFTSVAQRLPDEERYDLETLAGQLVEQGLHEGRKELSVRPKLRRQHNENTAAESGRDEENAEADASADGIPWSAVELAQQMFDAEIVSRESSPERETSPASQRTQEREAVDEREAVPA